MDKLEKIAKEFICELNLFEYQFTGFDKVWNVIFDVSTRKWLHINVVKYQDKYYLNELLHNYPTLEIDSKKDFEIENSKSNNFNSFHNLPIDSWGFVLEAAISHLKLVQKNWVETNIQTQKKYPLKYRKGIVPHSIINECLPNLIDLKKSVGIIKSNQIIKIIENGYFSDEDNLVLESFTVNRYLEYCKIAYHAVQKNIDKTIINNGKLLYECYADGRDEGLMKINPSSEKDFELWLNGKHPKKTIGGHPWEILRGGNTTHISLRVTRPNYNAKEGFLLYLEGNSFSRLKETIAIALALKKANLPFVFSNADEIRLRLLAQDNIGIVPDYESLHRANQNFEENNVFDVLHLFDIKSQLKTVKTFITWQPIPVLKPF